MNDRNSAAGRSSTAFRGAGLMMVVAVLAVPACTDTHPPVDPSLADEGRVLYAAARPTTGGAALSCAECHGEEGMGGTAPSLHDEIADHLRSHAQGGGSHPEGVKFPDLTIDDFNALASFLAGGTGSTNVNGNTNTDGGPSPNDLVGDAARGADIYAADHETSGAGPFSCVNCHADDGSSGFGPDIRGEEADHLQAHAQGGGRHPAGLKFPTLSDQDFADMAAFLALEHSSEDEHHEDDVHGAHR